MASKSKAASKDSLNSLHLKFTRYCEGVLDEVEKDKEKELSAPLASVIRQFLKDNDTFVDFEDNDIEDIRGEFKDELQARREEKEKVLRDRLDSGDDLDSLLL